MQLDEVQQVREEFSVDAANKALQQEGWKLLGFVQSEKYGGVVYVLGKMKGREPRPTVNPATFNHGR
jgi:hypothetical protein